MITMMTWRIFVFYHHFCFCFPLSSSLFVPFFSFSPINLYVWHSRSFGMNKYNRFCIRKCCIYNWNKKRECVPAKLLLGKNVSISIAMFVKATNGMGMDDLKLVWSVLLFTSIHLSIDLFCMKMYRIHHRRFSGILSTIQPAQEEKTKIKINCPPGFTQIESVAW